LSDNGPWAEGHWDDPRWGDPATRAHGVAGPGSSQPPLWPGEASPWPAPPPPPPGPNRRLNPLIAGLVGLAVGAAAALPFGFSHHTNDVRATPIPPPPAVSNGNGNGSSDAVAARVDPSIVDITSRLGFQRAVAAGTGMVITAGGDVLTNNHVIEGATSITATSVTTGASYTGTVLGTDPTEDVAVIHLARAQGLTPITVGNSRVTVGEPVVALGNAGGAGGPPAIAPGFVTGLDRQITATDSNGTNPQHLTGLIETDAPIRPGDSGGPLADMRAEVIGMDTAASASSQFGGGASRGFAIPIQRALAIAHQIQAGQGSSTVHIGPRGMIGVSVTAVTTGPGATVDSVTQGSPADRAGIRAGDTITAVDSSPVRTSDDLGKLIKAHGAGERVTVAWTTSSGASRSATMTLTAGPPD
jgi:S1-C subfamily serine protease